MSEHPHPALVKLFGVAAVIGMGGWMLLLGLYTFWMLQPAGLPTITQPIEVLNPGNRVAIGDPLILRLEVDKRVNRAPASSSRLLECGSGNLVTLTASPTPLPVGKYVVVSDNILLPAKVTPGDTCRAVFLIAFDINPVRTEVARYVSEQFTVLPPRGTP